jgi:lipopolysaccharide transport system ATP-binding protein
LRLGDYPADSLCRLGIISADRKNLYGYDITWLLAAAGEPQNPAGAYLDLMSTALQIEKLWKEYRLGVLGHGALYRDLQSWWARRRGREDPNSLVNLETAGGNSARGRIWALRDTSFKVAQGEVIGLIGRNGAGKSTLLKIISQVTAPTRGQVKIRGRVASLLEVGTGFHPELTGRENIFLNGAILGMSIPETRRKFDEIVDFSGVEKFVDTPVKRYSSGMYVRLAFAVAAHLEPEILVVDEVLAVGDAAFQKKCLGKLDDVSKEGRTVLLVSHNMGAIRGLCKRAIFIEGGEILEDGDAQQVVSNYLNKVTEVFIQGQPNDHEKVVIKRVILRNQQGESTVNFVPGDDITIEVHFHAQVEVERPYFWIGIYGQHGPLFGANMLLDGHRPDYIEGPGTLSCTFKSVPLLPQTYTVSMGVRAANGRSFLTRSKDVGFFNVVGTMSDAGLSGDLADAMSWGASSLVLPYEWQLPDGHIFLVRINRT